MQSLMYLKGANNRQQVRKKNPHSLWASKGLQPEEGEEKAVVAFIMVILLTESYKKGHQREDEDGSKDCQSLQQL